MYTSWWFQPIWKICSSNWTSSPNRGEHKTYFKAPPRLAFWGDSLTKPPFGVTSADYIYIWKLWLLAWKLGKTSVRIPVLRVQPHLLVESCVRLNSHDQTIRSLFFALQDLREWFESLGQEKKHGWRANPKIMLLLMEEIPQNHMGCIKPCKEWHKLPSNWCRISSINSSNRNSWICGMLGSLEKTSKNLLPNCSHKWW